jgi:uncharacterized membrane protein
VEDGVRVARVGTGDVVADGSIWIGLPTTPRTTSGWVVRIARPGVGQADDLDVDAALVGSPRPSLTR